MTRRVTWRPPPFDHEPRWMREAALSRLWERLNGLLGA